MRKFCTDAELLSKMQIPCHHEVHEGHEEFGNFYISIFYFVFFAIFVVKCLLRFGCGSAALGSMWLNKTPIPDEKI